MTETVELLKSELCGQTLTQTNSPKMLKCGHVGCYTCLGFFIVGPQTCPVCQAVSSIDEIKHYSQVLERLWKVNDTLKSKTDVSELLISIMKKQINDFSEVRNGHVNCNECDKSDDETNMQICKTCFFESISDRKESTSKSADSMKSLAICSTCALRKHVKKYHVVVDFFPVLSEEQFGKHSRNLKEKRGSYRNKIDMLKSNVDEMFIEVENSEKQISRMTDMIRRSKTTLVQEELVKKVAKNMDKFNEVLSKVKETIEDETEKLKGIVDKLSENNDKQNSEDCHEFVGDTWNSTAFPVSVSFSETNPLLKKKSACWMVMCEDSKKHIFKTEKDPVMSSECE